MTTQLTFPFHRQNLLYIQRVMLVIIIW